ncbi:hypothetical protein Q3G72_032025 [Acer saccharum]|nr:hypothetical protein Q3G72_032025 [Acer saccharum]
MKFCHVEHGRVSFFFFNKVELPVLPCTDLSAHGVLRLLHYTRAEFQKTCNRAEASVVGMETESWTIDAIKASWMMTILLVVRERNQCNSAVKCWRSWEEASSSR